MHFNGILVDLPTDHKPTTSKDPKMDIFIQHFNPIALETISKEVKVTPNHPKFKKPFWLKDNGIFI